MKKKGFTLVELLAVIAILAILAIIALPNVMKMMNDAKKNSFTTEAAEILKTAKQQWLADSMGSTSARTYSNVKVICNHGTDDCTEEDKLPLDGREIRYAVVIDATGVVTKLIVEDGIYYLDSDSATEVVVEKVGKPVDTTNPDNSGYPTKSITGTATWSLSGSTPVLTISNN